MALANGQFKTFSVQKRESDALALAMVLGRVTLYDKMLIHCLLQLLIVWLLIVHATCIAHVLLNLKVSDNVHTSAIPSYSLTYM